MRTNTDSIAKPSGGERLCYYCNEGNCALCTGWDRTVVDGELIAVPCAHGCRQDTRKPNQRATHQRANATRRRA